MGANRDISKLGPLPTAVGGAFVWTTAGWAQVTKANVGLTNVDNTADSAKPVSVAQQAALDGKTTLAATLAQMQQYGPGSQAVPVITDYSLAPETGIFRGSAGASANVPAGTNTSILFNSRYSATGAFQMVGELSASQAGTRLFARSQFGGAYYGYREVAFTDNPVFTGGASVTAPFRVGQYTLTTLPSASAFNGYEIDVTNSTVAPAGSKRCRSNGTNWLILNTNTPVS